MMEIIAQNPDAQLRSLRAFAQHPTLFKTGDAATEWLLRPPRSTLTLDPDSVRNGFLNLVFDGKPGRAELVPRLSVLFVPSHCLLEDEIVLGNTFDLAPTLSEDDLPSCCIPDPAEVLNDGYDTTISHFAFDLRRGYLVILARGVGGSLILTDMAIHRFGVSDFRGATVLPDGTLIGMGSAPICPFCSARTGNERHCGCSSSMRERLFGPAISFSGWQELMDFGRNTTFSTSGHYVCEIDGITPFPLTVDPPKKVEYHFHTSKSMMDIRSAYLNHVTVATLSIAVDPLALCASEFLEDEDLPDSFVEAEDYLVATSSGSADQASSPRINHRNTTILKSSDEKSTFHCLQCDRRFPKLHNLQRHVAAIHNRERSYHCNQCESSFTQLTNLKRHLQSVHEGVRQFTCSHCARSFAQRSNLLRHENSKHRGGRTTSASLVAGC
mmetsp:Transcript_47524/g.116446  ORF Transcript_47524/g.116446 Transcript_47524/m.116446 type:complete len:440 (-) Transcript_47524:214-1533(-)